MVCTSLETAHAAVVELVNDFAANEAHYLSPGYSEAQARVSFIDKLWMALGWDVHHEQQKNPYAQEVKVEDPQKIQGANRRADYAFHTAPNFRDARFFCEAKKPAVQLKMDKDAAFQTIRYGWSAGTPLAVLTDFEQLHVLDCRAKPDIETALARSHLYFHYQDWLDPEKFAQLYYLFSREAFRDGGFDAYVSKLPRPKKVGKQLGLLRTGTQPVDAAFLHDLGEYRETLAKLLKAADHSLDGDALTELVQRILDRLVFLRFLEDKLIETEIQVQHFSRAAGGHSWAKFLAACAKLNARYNGIVFKAHPILDTPGRLPVDDARFADLCEDLSHTKSPYDFNAIPIHILGSIYERFLGSVIVTTEQRARVEEKPEVREAGGVYYTPEYIVRYICEQTVGRLIEEKSPAQIAKMRFADIACGSGSFLLGVYDLLLRYHGEWYNAHRAEAEKENLAPPDKSKKRKKEFIPAVAEHAGVLRLTLEKKREILLNNVFGVDLDPQAVEVAQLSLYLKLLEDETTASAAQHYLDFHEALLPSLNKNIVRGNSLIERDIHEGQFEFSNREEVKLAAMHFEDAFPSVFPSGGKGRGFDAVVGNPPYVDLKGMPTIQVDYLFDHYRFSNNRINLFAAFIERGLAKCRSDEFLFSMIVPTALLTQDSYKALRRFIVEKYHVASICRLPNESFGEAAGDVKVDTVIVVVQPKIPNTTTEVISYAGYDRISAIDAATATLHTFTKQDDWLPDPDCVWSLAVDSDQAALLRKIELESVSLDECAEFCLGLTPYDKYKGHTQSQIEAQVFHATSKKDNTFKRLLSGNDVRRYSVTWNGERWISYGPWLGAPREPRFFTSKRILVKQIVDWTSKRIWAALTSEELYNTQNAFNLLAKKGWPPEFLIGIINSKLMTFYHQKKFLDEFKMRFQKILIKDCRRFPIHKIESPAQKAIRDKIVSLVEAMLATQQQLAAATSENDRSYYETKAAGLDRQIDELTCDLYGLTPEERALVASA